MNKQTLLICLQNISGNNRKYGNLDYITKGTDQKKI